MSQLSPPEYHSKADQDRIESDVLDAKSKDQVEEAVQLPSKRVEPVVTRRVSRSSRTRQQSLSIDLRLRL